MIREFRTWIPDLLPTTFALTLLVSCGGSDTSLVGPPAPTNVQTFPGPGYVDVSWEHPGTGVSGFRVERQNIEASLNLDGDSTLGAQAMLAELAATARGYRDVAVSPGASYTYSVSAIDVDGQSSEPAAADAPVEPAPNSAPTSSGMPDVAVSEGAEARELVLTEYFVDAEEAAGALSYEVGSVSEPSVVDATITATTLQLVFGAVGSSDIEIIASDSAGLSAVASFTVTVSAAGTNTSPTTSSIPDVTVRVGAADQGMDLTTYFSDAEDGATGLVYTVTSISDASVVTATVTGTILELAFLAEGSSSVAVSATDTGGLSVQAQFTVTVAAAINTPPVASLVSTPLSGDAPLTVTLDATGSTDDLGITAYEFDFGDGSTVTNTDGVATHTYSAFGTYTASVMVFDADGATGIASVTIDVAQGWTWDGVQTIQGEYGAIPYGMASDGGENLFVMMSLLTSQNGTYTEGTMVKKVRTDGTRGELVWSHTRGAGLEGWEVGVNVAPRAIAAAHDGGAFVVTALTVTTSAGQSQSMMLLRLDANGEPAWEIEIDVEGHNVYRADDVATGPDGSIWVSGMLQYLVDGVTSGYAPYAKQYSLSGTVLSTTVIPEGSSTRPITRLSSADIEVLADGTVYLGGDFTTLTVDPADTTWGWYLIQLDGSGGEAWRYTLVTTTREDTTVGIRSFQEMSITPDGTAYVIDDGPKLTPARIYALEGPATLVWQDDVGRGTNPTDLYDVEVGSDGYIYGVGVTFETLTQPVEGLLDPILVKYDQMGMRIWTRQHHFGSNEKTIHLEILGSELYATYWGSPSTDTATSGTGLVQFGSDGMP